MPDIDLIPVPLHNALEPYHVDYDNLPLKALITRIGLVNSAVEIVSQDVRNAIGNRGTLASRLGQSLDDGGSLKTEAVDSAAHGIGHHTDGLGPDGKNYVRMLETERTKLTAIAEDATNLTLEVHSGSNIIFLPEGPIILESTAGIQWAVEAPNRIRPHLTFPIDAAHRHYYDIDPVNVNSPPDYQNYSTGSGVPFMEGSLRVYVNGVRLPKDGEVYVPGFNVSAPWTLNSFAPASDGLGFSLLNAITIHDIIRIDFDIALS